jgi:ATP-dependent RNA helicase DeaD
MKTFQELQISDVILPVLTELGYEVPSPIQEQSIPVLLNGNDLLAQAQTGTGKTAAFALPILSKINLKLKQPQALILAPTRELAIQVAESFMRYAKHMENFHVVPVYGGQDIRPQLRALQRGAHIIVGTPGRIMDHIRRGCLSLDKIKMLVLDEADEMLRMGFIEDVEWILDQIPGEHQTALFSATIPQSIRKVANKYLNEPVEVKIVANKNTVSAIKQFYTVVSRNNKVEVLSRFLEVEDMEAAIIFTRTKVDSDELATKLKARGFAAAAINGDMRQEARESVIKRVKQGSLDIVVATEVAARGLDVERLSHVINYDIPDNTESYVHRIGRTGRAGREGKSLLFVTPREKGMLRDIESAVRQPILPLATPTIEQVNQKRAGEFSANILQVLQNQDLDHYRDLVTQIVRQHECNELDIAAAMAYLLQGDKAAPVAIEETMPRVERRPGGHRDRSRDNRSERGDREQRPRRRHNDSDKKPSYKPAKKASKKTHKH